MLVFIPGLLAVAASIGLGIPTPGELVVWGIDGRGWYFLAVAAAFLLLCTAICWVAIEIARAAPQAWRTATGYVTVCVVASGVLLAAWPGLIVGAFALSTEYRTIGSVGGRDLVVRRDVGLGDSSLQVGLRRGAFVEFGSTGGNTLVRSAPRPLSEWSFAFHERSGRITIRYAFAPGGSGGTLLIPRPG